MVSFDCIPHRVIMQGLTNVVADGNILTLVERFLSAGVLQDGIVQSTTLGTPQGGVLSPLLANIALNFLDWHLDQHGYRFVRYADDFVIICNQKELLRDEIKPLVETFMAERGLELSPDKTKLTHINSGFDFLGQTIRKYGQKFMTIPSLKSLRAITAKITSFLISDSLDVSG